MYSPEEKENKKLYLDWIFLNWIEFRLGNFVNFSVNVSFILTHVLKKYFYFGLMIHRIIEIGSLKGVKDVTEE